MALVLNDRVKETTTTTGTGTLTLGGAVTGFETFAAGIGNSNTTYYAVTLPGTSEFEVGLGTLNSDSSTLARTTVISSSNSDNAVNFSSGTKTIFCTIPASKSVFLDASGNATLGADLSVGDDLRLISDSAVLSFGADSDTTLTHTDGSGLTLNSTNKLMFRDSALSVSSSADGQLDIDADTEVEITATTVDINGDVEISGATTQTGVSTSAAKDVFNAGLSVKNGSSSAGFIEFFEDSDNGTNKVTLIGPASSGDVTLTLPTTTDTLAVAGDITALAIALG